MKEQNNSVTSNPCIFLADTHFSVALLFLPRDCLIKYMWIKSIHSLLNYVKLTVTWIRPHSPDSNYLSMNHYSSLNTIPCSFQTSLTLCALKKIAHLQNNSTKWGSCQGVWGGHKTKNRHRGTENSYHFLSAFFQDFFHISKRQSETESEFRSKWKQNSNCLFYYDHGCYFSTIFSCSLAITYHEEGSSSHKM